MNHHPRTYRLDRLYFRYIRGTSLDGKWNLEQFSKYLESLGLITIVSGRYSETEKFSKFSDRKSLIKLLRENSPRAY